MRILYHSRELFRFITLARLTRNIFGHDIFLRGRTPRLIHKSNTHRPCMAPYKMNADEYKEIFKDLNGFNIDVLVPYLAWQQFGVSISV